MAISVMIKPASSACNLRCEYCFYSSVSDEREIANRGMMSEETAKRVIDSALAFGKDSVYFTFQGGEPLLRGIEFFRFFVDYVNSVNKNNTAVSYFLQTNATLLNDEWCSFFKKNGFLLGVSLDGDRELNDYRKYPNGSNSFDDIMKGVELLKKYDVPFNILCVLTKRLANNFRKSYRFFKENGLNYLQYIPCLKPFGEEDNEYSMSVDDYSQYLNSAFKLYYNSLLRNSFVSIRQLDNYRLLSQGKNAEQCGMNGVCSNQFVVEGDGAVYPCDFYCTDELYLGNINEQDFEQMYNSPVAVEFIKESFKMNDDCKTCEYFYICRAGGCKRNKQAYDYCKAYKQFFAQNEEFLKRLK